MKTSIEENFLKNLYKQINNEDKTVSEENIKRQPVHVVYGGADKFRFDTALKLGRFALKTLADNANEYKTFFEALDVPVSASSEVIYKRIIEKLKREPVEDFRIDFEDGYGIRSDGEEDKSAEDAAKETVTAMQENTLPPFFGIRIKPLDSYFFERAVRTFDIYLSTLLSGTNGKLPENFLITLPKISSAEQVLALVNLLRKFEETNSLPSGSLKFEIMIETPQIIINRNGVSELPALISASEGRCFAAHLGAYDFTSSLDISAKNQTLHHPLCDYVRNIMKAAFAGSGIFLSDGATNILPVAKIKNENLTEYEEEINRKSVFNAWQISFRDIIHSLHSGFYQGWDLHPAQIPVRYAAVYSFFIDESESSAKRLKGFIDKAARVSLSGNIFDDAASAQGLLNFFARGINCGALTEKEVKQTGITIEEIQTKSFYRILESGNYH